MSSDLKAMIRAAARGPESDPGPLDVWRRSRRRRAARGVSLAVGLAGTLVVAGLALSGPGLRPVVGAVGTDDETSTPTDEIGPDRDEVYARWKVHGIGVLLEVPVAWTQPGDDPLTRSGETGYVRLTLGTGPVTLEQACEAERERPGSPFSGTTEIELRIVDGEQACLLRPAIGDGALAVVALPYPPEAGMINGRSYLFLQADVRHLTSLVASLDFVAPEQPG